ncbi:MAG: radical SAM protein [Candidatus Hodarchaeota archaeon]
MQGQIIIRPPCEAYSVLIGVTEGCRWNKCSFCGVYKGLQSFRVIPLPEIQKNIEHAKQVYSVASRIFLAGGSALSAPTEQLLSVLQTLKRTFPDVKHISSYAKNHDLLEKSDKELEQLVHAGLQTVYMGLETGSARLLEKMKKGTTPEKMIDASQKAMKAGLTLSLYVILGLGGVEDSEEHAQETAQVLNKINPHYIRFRTLNIMPNSLLYYWEQKGKFQLLNPLGILKEQRNIIAGLDCDSYICNDHVSNYENFEGSLKFKRSMLKLLDSRIKDPVLKNTPPRRLTRM